MAQVWCRVAGVSTGVARTWSRYDAPRNVKCKIPNTRMPTSCACSGRASARRPGPEFLGVAHDPDVLDPATCDVEGEHCHGDAVLLGQQAGLAVDRAFQE